MKRRIDTPKEVKEVKKQIKNEEPKIQEIKVEQPEQQLEEQSQEIEEQLEEQPQEIEQPEIEKPEKPKQKKSYKLTVPLDELEPNETSKKSWLGYGLVGMSLIGAIAMFKQ